MRIQLPEGANIANTAELMAYLKQNPDASLSITGTAKEREVFMQGMTPLLKERVLKFFHVSEVWHN